jgi:S-adenosyl-L-methionine hydrolase (adenosine-forming)
MSRPIVFLSDFGLQDEYVGICHGMIARIDPLVRVIDLTHGIPPHEVLTGALTLAEAVPYMPEDAVYLAVVDPGVGTSRAAIAIATNGGQRLVGPDNGLLSLAWERLGGPSAAVRISSPDVVLPSPWPTFHARDVFAPAAARLARGDALAALGASLDPASLIRAQPPQPRVGSGWIRCRVMGIDRFGNVRLNVRMEHLTEADLGEGGSLTIGLAGSRLTVPRVATFGDVAPGHDAVVVDSGGWVALIRNGESASAALALSTGDEVMVGRGDGPAR